MPTFDKFSLELLFIYFSPQIGDDVLQKLTDGNTNFHRTVNDKVNQSLFLFKGNLHNKFKSNKIMLINKFFEICLKKSVYIRKSEF